MGSNSRRRTEGPQLPTLGQKIYELVGFKDWDSQPEEVKKRWEDAAEKTCIDCLSRRERGEQAP